MTQYGFFSRFGAEEIENLSRNGRANELNVVSRGYFSLRCNTLFISFGQVVGVTLRIIILLKKNMFVLPTEKIVGSTYNEVKINP